MRIKHHKPPIVYVALVCFTATMWRSHKQDDVIYSFENWCDEYESWQYEDYNGPCAEISSDYALAFDTKRQRSAFIRSITKDIGKHIRLVTTVDCTS